MYVDLFSIEKAKYTCLYVQYVFNHYSSLISIYHARVEVLFLYELHFFVSKLYTCRQVKVHFKIRFADRPKAFASRRF